MTHAAKNIASTSLNGFDPAALETAVNNLGQSPEAAQTRWSVRSTWQGGARVRSEVSHYEIGGQRIERRHTLTCDEPRELFGEDSAPNPQEMLLAAVGSCMSVVYAINAATMGIALHGLAIELGGDLDLRGPFGVDLGVLPGFPEVQCTVHIRSDATQAQLEELHQTVAQLSPNLYHLTHAIPMNVRLVTG